MVINPEEAAAKEIARILKFPSAMKIEGFAKGRVELLTFKIPEGSRLIGMSIKDVATKFKTNVTFCTIERESDAYIANGNFVFEEKDVVSIIGSPKQANEFFDKIDYRGEQIRNAIIVGAGAITHYLCEILDRSGIKLTVIERDLALCESFSNDWEKVQVIHGDGLNKELLLEEGVENTDAFVSLLRHDEDNILLSLFCNDISDCKLITKISRTDYDQVLSKLDLDAVICPKNITSDIILRYVRATHNSEGSNIERLYNLIQDKVEAAEFIIKENSAICNQPLSKLKFKENVLVASITRGNEVIIPRGWSMIKEGDTVIVITADLALHDITDVLQKD
jgi:trk system potassium uptake protein TrkA